MPQRYSYTLPEAPLLLCCQMFGQCRVPPLPVANSEVVEEPDIDQTFGSRVEEEPLAGYSCIFGGSPTLLLAPA